ncbi:glycosyltransferase family 39 protein [soil metagenome]
MLGWLIAGLIVVSWFALLATRALVPSDEGRYAEIAREMHASGDWVTIRYNGLKYFEKPPLHLWVSALAFSVFGVGEWQARLCGALSGLSGIVLTMLATRCWFGRRVAVMAGLALLAMPTWTFASHFNSLDITVAGALTAVLMSLLLAQHPDASPGERRNWMWVCWVAMALALLGKGLIGVALPGLVGVIYLLVSRQWWLLRRLHIVSGLVLMLIVSVPWFVLISARNPEFAEFFFIHEHWTRFTSTEHHRAGPLWYFVPQLLAGMLPWLGLFVAMTRATRSESRAQFRPLLMLTCWTLSIFVFFSLSGSKLPGYIVPVFPAIAGLVAVALERMSQPGMKRQLSWIVGSSVVAIAISIGFAIEPRADYGQMFPWVCTALVVMAAGAWLARRLELRGDRLANIAVLSIATYVAVNVAMLGYVPIARARANVDLVEPVQQVLTAQTPIYMVRLLDHTLPFYLGRTMTPVEMPDELEFGTQQEPDKWLPTLTSFIERWRDGSQAIAVMKPDVFDSLLARGVPMRVVARSADRVVVSNFEPPVPNGSAR